MSAKRKVDDLSREEDFRDYEARDVEAGWPYDDASGVGSRPLDNQAYGRPGANFDESRNRGFQTDDAGFDGLEEPVRDATHPVTSGAEEDDECEERLTDAIEALGVVDMNSLDVHVVRGKATLIGVIDDEQRRRQIVDAAERVPGIRAVLDNLRVAGTDGRVSDAD